MKVEALHPMLTVRDAAAAAHFYEQAFEAEVVATHTAPTGHRVIRLLIHGHELYAVDENPQGFNLSPAALNGTSVRLSMIVDDPDAVAARAIKAGAKELFPVADQPYGMRQGRVVDPFGHHWVIGKPLVS
jgi:PhnB protein